MCCSCVSIAIMSPLTAKVKCPHYGVYYYLESEALEAVTSSQDGLGEVYGVYR